MEPASYFSVFLVIIIFEIENFFTYFVFSKSSSLNYLAFYM